MASCLAYVMAIAADNILTISWMGQNILPQFLLHNNFKSGHHFSQEGSITKSYQQNQNISCIFQVTLGQTIYNVFHNGNLIGINTIYKRWTCTFH